MWVPCSTKHLNSIVSSYQPESLPVGYSLRLATKRDIIRIIYFDFIDYDSYSIDRIFYLLFILILIALSGIIFNVLGITIISLFSTASFMIFLSLKLSFSIIDNTGNTSNHAFWIVEHKNKICGKLSSIKANNYTFIHRLLIGSKYRNIGLGKALIDSCVNSSTNPVYLVCHSRLKNFYNSCGFGDADYSNIPSNLSRWHTYKNFYVMVFREVH